ncbi:hypothetical protein Slin15195_G042680 [Septoria linicola]|uniref:Uncharacterized protein n=1 Tax=Septoria linicola TaxID=215465 RepID=A0A9Q9AMQ0_9PEZI|nr:hypothetical protein Slin14017_G046200 [Septoria linicola]USW50949.1 hypothetical protein Slin15195_G042680 [Septoria linicola]
MGPQLALRMLVLIVLISHVEPYSISQYVKKGITYRPKGQTDPPSIAPPAAGSRYGAAGSLPPAGIASPNSDKPPNVDDIKYASSPSENIEALATPYFQSKLPEDLKSVYGPVTPEKQVETAATTCDNFNADETFTAQYLREVTPTAPVQTPSAVNSGASATSSMVDSLVALAILIQVKAMIL